MVGEDGSVVRISSRQVMDNQGRENARLPDSESCGPVASCPGNAAGKSTCVSVKPVVIFSLSLTTALVLRRGAACSLL